MKRIHDKWFRFACCITLCAGIATGILSTPASRKASVVLAQSKAKPKAAASMCSATAQPNIGNIAGAISNQGKGPFITDLNELSQSAWCTFMWLNWPQESNPKIGDCLNPAGGQTCQVRWETWLPSTSVYCPDGAAPNPKTGCAGAALAARKASLRTLRVGVNSGTRGTMDVGPGGIPLGPTQPTGFALPDKNNTASNESVIFYESVEEPSLVQFLIKNKLYNLDGQQALYNSLNLKGAPGTAGMPPPSGLLPGQKPTPLDFPPTAFEIKPSWYITSATEVQSLGMINAKAGPPAGIPLPNSCPTSPCTIGLTGFHIIWKVFPKSPWFWATFEFNGNTTIAPMLQTQQPNANLPSNTNVSKGPYIPYNFQSQTDPMSVAADAATAQFQKLLANTPLANYRLVGVQIASTLDGTPTGAISYLANNHLETDFGAVQIGNKSGAPQPVNRSSSCITCHYNASIGSTNTTACKYDSTGKYQGGAAYFRRAPIYLRNQDAANPPFSNNNGLGACAAYNDANGNPAGYVGPFKPSVYSHQCESKGSFVSGDFVWSIQEASWASPTKGCPATRPPAQ
jgi:hypothetical protein